MKKLLSVLLLTVILVPLLQAEDKMTEDEFWKQNETKTAAQGISAFPMSSFVYAGLVGYFNFADNGNDENTVGLKITANMKEMVQFLQIRLDAFVGIGGPAEGLIEANVNLVKGLTAGLGISYTKRLKTSPRLSLMVEDEGNSARRGGIYIMKDSSGGVEISWPLVDKWNFFGEFGVENDDRYDIDYTRIICGVQYQF